MGGRGLADSVLFAVLLGFSGAALATGTLQDSPLWRFNFGNDIFFEKDNKLSAGWVLQKHSSSVLRWSEVEGVPEFIPEYAARLESLSSPLLHKRAHWALGQVIQTPTDISRSDRIYDDVPYAGALTLQAGVYAYDDSQMLGVEFTTGIVGPLSLAEQTQKLVHSILGNEQPRGWKHQLKTEPVLNLNFMRKVKTRRAGSDGLDWDQALSIDGSIGNLYTQVTGGIEWRFGRNLPGGFLYSPLPPGFGMSHRASLPPPRPDLGSIYVSAALRVSALAWVMFLDGNSYDSEYRVPKEPVVWQATLGFHYERPQWAFHFTLLRSGDDVDVRRLSEAESSEAFGALEFEWRIP